MPFVFSRHPSVIIGLILVCSLILQPCQSFAFLRAPNHTQGLVYLAGSLGGPGYLLGDLSHARMLSPSAITQDPSGNMYIADSALQVVFKVTASTGIVSLFAGIPGSSGYVDGAGASAKFANPVGIASDTSGNIFISDNFNNAIRKITPAGVVSTFAGGNVTGAVLNGNGTGAKFNAPAGLAIDSGNTLYVAEQNGNDIRKITSGAAVTTLSGTGAVGSANGAGVSSTFNAPQAVAVDSSFNVYVADTSNNLIRKITSTGATSTLAGSGTAGFSNATGVSAQFSFPIGIGVDTSGNVFVADYSNHCIRQITPSGSVTLFAGNPGISATREGLGSAAWFLNPIGIYIDSSGSIYTSNGPKYGLVRKILNDGTVSTYVGTGGSLANPTFGSGTGANISLITNASIPMAVSDSNGNTFFATGNNGFSLEIAKISPSGDVSSFAGTLTGGAQTDGTGSGASFGAILAITIDASDNIYVIDEFNGTSFKIRKITPAAVVTTICTGCGPAIGSIGGMTFDGSTFYYSATDNPRILRLPSPYTTSTVIAGSTGGTQGTTDSTTGTSALFREPDHMVLDSTKSNLYVADRVNGNIRKISLTAPYAVSTFAGSNTGVLGTGDGIGTSARFNSPSSITIDPSNNLYVCDGSTPTVVNGTVRKITPSGTVTTVLGSALTSGWNLGNTPGNVQNPLLLSYSKGRLVLINQVGAVSAPAR